MDIPHWTNLIFEKLEGWVTTFIKMLPNLMLAIVVIVVGYFIARFIQRFSYKVTLRISNSDSVSSVISVILQTMAVLFAMPIALILNLDKAVATLLTGVGIVGLPWVLLFRICHPILSRDCSWHFEGRSRSGTKWRLTVSSAPSVK